jgi:hypothetical protein
LENHTRYDILNIMKQIIHKNLNMKNYEKELVLEKWL